MIVNGSDRNSNSNSSSMLGRRKSRIARYQQHTTELHIDDYMIQTSVQRMDITSTNLALDTPAAIVLGTCYHILTTNVNLAQTCASSP